MALNQLVKGCQMAMQGAALLAADNERLRAANERQKRKKKLNRKFAKGMNLIATPQEVPIVQDSEIERGAFTEDNTPIEIKERIITCRIS
jgi:hypothetical protein